MSRVQGQGVQSSLSWVPASGGAVPHHAVMAGSNIYVGRAQFSGAMIPGKVVPSHNCLYISYGGKEHSIKDYEVLCNTSLPMLGQAFYWQHCSNGMTPPGAFAGGHDSNGEPSYVGKGYVNGDLCVGKVQPSHRGAYFPWGGQEHHNPNYEVLCFQI